MPVPIILDTDIDTDCDDVGALAMLHALANNGEAEILGVICDAPTVWGAPCIKAINRYYGRAETPVGTIQVDDYETNLRYELYRQHLELMGKGRVYEPYNRAIAQEFPDENKTGESEDGVALYRKLLAEQPDGSVVIAAIGFLTVLESLLDSAPDEHSSLGGTELVRTKVKLLVTMGGGSFPKGRDSFNWWMDKVATGAVLNNWPARLAVSEWGGTILTGARLCTETPETNPVRRAYAIYLFGESKSRCSWDQVAVFYAVRGARDYFTEIQGHRIHFSPDTGEHEWLPVENEDGHISLQQAASDETLAGVIEDLMTQPAAR